MVSKQVLSIIVCPLCKGPLEERENGLYCSMCDKLYPVQDNVPHLLFDQERLGSLSFSRSFEFKSRFRNSRCFKVLKYIFGADFVPYNPLRQFSSLFLDKAVKGGDYFKFRVRFYKIHRRRDKC